MTNNEHELYVHATKLPWWEIVTCDGAHTGATGSPGTVLLTMKYELWPLCTKAISPELLDRLL